MTAPGGERVPQRIGPYEVLLDIGSGGMGTISLARATGAPVGASGFARLVAIKRPHGALVSQPEVLQRFLDEARLLAQVHHANVVGIHQIGADPGGQFLVLDYIEGGSLDELITRSLLRRKKLPPPIVLRIVSDVLAGLHAVHEAADVDGNPLRMLHRDVSVQNVLVGRDGVARLADFGIAKGIISSTVTDKAYLQGRIPYMPPEYLRREEVDRRLDVYAAGVTTWTALAGRLPWSDASEAQIVHHAVHHGVPPLSEAGVTIAPAIQAIVGRACERDHRERYASARDMLDAIEELGRRTGWLASHAEVGALVEELLGIELRARRSAIAQRLSAAGETPLPAASAPVSIAVSLPTVSGGVASSGSEWSVSLPGVPSVGASSTSSASAPAAGVAGGGAHVAVPDSTLRSAVPVVVAGSPRDRAFIESDVANPPTDAPLVVPGVPRPTSRGRAGIVAAVAVVAAAGVAAAALGLRAIEAPATAEPATSGGAATATVPPAASPPVPSSSAEATPSPSDAPAPSSSADAPAASAARPRPSAAVVKPAGPRPPAVPTSLPTGISTSNPYRK